MIYRVINNSRSSSIDVCYTPRSTNTAIKAAEFVYLTRRRPDAECLTHVVKYDGYSQLDTEHRSNDIKYASHFISRPY